jgi:hypothetical protein
MLPALAVMMEQRQLQEQEERVDTVITGTAALYKRHKQPQDFLRVTI